MRQHTHVWRPGMLPIPGEPVLYEEVIVCKLCGVRQDDQKGEDIV